MISIYIRPLELKDANISYKWRNDPVVWKYTGNRPNKTISLEVERKWLESVLASSDTFRFAICIKESDIYLGNVQLTHVTENNAKFHIFVGDRNYWGKGVAQQATHKIIEFAKNHLKLESLYLDVDLKNQPAVHVYKKVGFRMDSTIPGRMIFNLT